MSLIRRGLALALVALALVGATHVARAIDKIPPDPKAEKLLNDFFAALGEKDDAARMKKVMPLLHKTLLDKTGTDLTADVKEHQYKKACDNAKFYAVPVQIFEVHKGREMTVGFKETAEKGRIDKYFVKKKEGQAGRPAPLHVFWPADGGEPKLINIGSL